MIMEFRRSGTRDERRRRVLMDETCTREADADSSGDSAAGRNRPAVHEPPRRYSEGASTSHQPHITDLVPHRAWMLVVVFLLCTTFITGLVAVYGYLAVESYPVAVEMLPAVDLAADNNMSVWFCSALLASGSVLSLLIYQIRRYRTDDYRGRYRMWFWFAGELMLGSMNSVADLEQALTTVSLHAAGIPDYGDAVLVGSAVTAFILLVLLLRLGIEVRSSWGALLSLAVSAACMGTVLAVRLGWLWTDAQMFRVMARALLMMVGHAALFFTLCVYGACVYREANGLSKPVKATRKSRRRRREAKRSDDDQETPRPKKQRRAESASAGQEAPASKKRGRPARQEEDDNQPAQRSEPKAAKRRADQPARPQQAEDDDPDDEELTKLSKSERRRLRKQRRRERQQQ